MVLFRGLVGRRWPAHQRETRSEIDQTRPAMGTGFACADVKVHCRATSFGDLTHNSGVPCAQVMHVCAIAALNSGADCGIVAGAGV